MVDRAPTPERSLSLDQELRIDAVCQSFEAGWQTAEAGTRPRIEVYLGGTTEPERTALLEQLLLVELEYRDRVGEHPVPADYLNRFPRCAELIDTAFRRMAAIENRPAHSPGPDGLQPPPTSESPNGQVNATSPPAAEQTGRAPDWPRIPGYDLLEELGRGGMGVVYKARQRDLRRLEAVKTIKDDALAGSKERALFRQEAEAVARLQHPYIVQIYEFREHEGRPFIAMELAAGGSLDTRLDDGPLPPREAGELVERLARAIHYAHEQNIIHRDLKPANVLLAADRTPKITDFGLAKHLENRGSLIESGALVGTPPYMAPEQALGKTQEVGRVTDVYALGAVLYQCLTGRPPF
jgi:serine/threonine protein kinase